MTTDAVNSVAIIGAGTMGPGMAAVFATHGYETALMDIKPDVLENAKEQDTRLMQAHLQRPASRVCL